MPKTAERRAAYKEVLENAVRLQKQRHDEAVKREALRRDARDTLDRLYETDYSFYANLIYMQMERLGWER